MHVKISCKCLSD